MENTVMEPEDRCPICLDRMEETSYILPCLHQFCYPCIMRWAETTPKCPLCKRKVKSILHSVQADNKFNEYVLSPPSVPSVNYQARGASGNPSALSLYQPAAPQQPPTELLPVGGFYPSVWASIFRVYPIVLDLLVHWLHQELQQIFEDAQEAAAVESLVLSGLRFFGLDEPALINLLRAFMGRRTRIFVQQLLQTVVQRCSRQARLHLGLENAPDAEQREGNSETEATPRHPAS